MNDTDLDSARSLIAELGGVFHGTSVYLDEASEPVTHDHLAKLLPLLVTLPELSLGISDSAITDDTLHLLSRFPNLVDLCLTGTNVTDCSVASLGHLTNLAGLILNETSVTDSGVESLRPLRKLKRLGLGPNATDACADVIRSWERLRYLILEPRKRCRFSDEVLVRLKTEMKLVITLGGSDPTCDTEYV